LARRQGRYDDGTYHDHTRWQSSYPRVDRCALDSVLESKGGTYDRIRWEDRGSHRRWQRHGPRAGPSVGGGSLQCRDVRRLADRPPETQRRCETAGLPQGLRVTTHIVDVADRTPSSGFATRLPTVTRPTRSTCCSTTPVPAAAAAWSPTAATSGSARSTSAGAASITAPARFCKQHQRLLSLGRASHPAHRLFGREIRGQGIHRSADHRFADQRAAHP
jgi:hypothetical protein